MPSIFAVMHVESGNSGYSLCNIIQQRLQHLTFVFLCLYKWKNHFSEMKKDVGMSVHEK